MEVPNDTTELINLGEDSEKCDIDLTPKEENDLVKVTFADVDDLYPTDCDLRCRYFFKTPLSPPNPGDRIAIFKVGWKNVTDYYLFKMVKVPSEEQLLASQRIYFCASNLPKNINELYQLCYLTHDNLVLGASTPFGFYNATPQELVCIEDKTCQEVMIYKSRLSVLHDRVGRIEEEKELSDLKMYAFCSCLKQVELELASSKKEIQLVSSSTISLQAELEKQKQANIELDEKYKRLDETYLKCKGKLIEAEEEISNKSNELVALKKELYENEKNIKEQGTEMNDKLLALKKDLYKKEEKNKELDAEMNVLRAKCIEQEDISKQMNLYTESLKEELDSTKIQLASFQEDHKRRQQIDISVANKEIIKLKEENSQLSDHLCHATNILEQLLMWDGACSNDRNSELGARSEFPNTLSSESLRENHTSEMLINDLMLKKQSLERLQEELKNHQVEKEELRKKMEYLESHRYNQKEELIELVSSLRCALLKLPEIEEQWKLLIESARVLGRTQFKKNYDSVMCGDQSPSTEACNLIDNLCITALCYDSLVEEHRKKTREIDQLAEINVKLIEDNNNLKKRVVELEEISKELDSCFSAIRKTNCDPEIKALKTQLQEISAKRDELERELKGIKTARALSAIGQVTVNTASASAAAHNIPYSELPSSSLDQTSTEDLQRQVQTLQNFLKKSAVEYAKLYQKFLQKTTNGTGNTNVIESSGTMSLDPKQS